jgi:hypothetical protein
MREQTSRVIPLFTVLNFCLAALSWLGFLSFGCILVFGVFFSGDTGEDLFAGVTGCVLALVVSLITTLLYLMAAIGLIRRTAWGYYCHLVGAVVPALTCLGLAYTLPAFIFALRPEFQGEFFPSQRRGTLGVADED